MQRQPPAKGRAAIIPLVLLVSTFLTSAPGHAQSARGSLRISFIIEPRFGLQVEEAANKVTLKAPGASKTLSGSAANSLSLNTALAEGIGTSQGEPVPTNKHLPKTVDVLVFAK